MKYMLTTDTHFYHEGIIEFCQRPKGFERLIVAGWKDLEPKMHTLIHLGDICLGRDAEVHKEFIEPLRVKKILIRGNHDKKSSAWYLDHGWDMVCSSMTIERQNKRILFSHIPQVWDGYYDVNFHGHFHNSNHRRLEAELVKDRWAGQRLLALEYNHYRLWDLDKELSKLPSCNRSNIASREGKG